MTRRAFTAGLLLLATTVASAEELTVATYNVENYVATDRMIAAGYRQDYPKPEQAKAALRSVIRSLNADVLVLQEMGPRVYLDELQRDLRTTGMDYPEAFLTEGSDPDRHVAVLSRCKFAAVRTHADLSFKYFEGRETVKRGVLEIVLSTPDGEVTLWALHLKSRYTDRPDDPESALRRAGEAMTARNYILDRMGRPEESRFMVLGDFNDVIGSAALRYLTKRGKLTIAKLLPAADSRGEHWTYHYHRDDTYSRVDHILVSPGLLPAVVGGAAHIYDGADVEIASDHRPLWVRINLGRGSRSDAAGRQQQP